MHTPAACARTHRLGGARAELGRTPAGPVGRARYYRPYPRRRGPPGRPRRWPNEPTATGLAPHGPEYQRGGAVGGRLLRRTCASEAGLTAPTAFIAPRPASRVGVPVAASWRSAAPRGRGRPSGVVRSPLCPRRPRRHAMMRAATAGPRFSARRGGGLS